MEKQSRKKTGAEPEKAISGREAKLADRIAIEERGIDSLLLMENASRTVTDHILLHFPKEIRLLVLSGIGNNGADGVCIARQLLCEGYSPALLLAGELTRASWELLHQLSLYKKHGGRISYAEEPSSVRRLFEHPAEQTPELLIDAVFGIGLTRRVGGVYETLLQRADALPCRKLSVDIPSGINADTGELMGAGIRADWTITFGRRKHGLLRGEGRRYAGELLVRKIGIPEDIYEEISSGKESAV